MSDAQTNKTAVRLKLIRELAIAADKQFAKAENLGRLAACNQVSRAQITGLENIANTAMKVSDILNYLKTQTARKEFWQRERLGPQLIDFIHQNLRQARHDICQIEDIKSKIDSNDEQWIHLSLIRDFIRQFAAQYEYQGMLRGGGASDEA